MKQSATPFPVDSLVDMPGQESFSFIGHVRHGVMNRVLTVSLQNRTSGVCDAQDTTTAARNKHNNMVSLTQRKHD